MPIICLISVFHAPHTIAADPGPVRLFLEGRYHLNPHMWILTDDTNQLTIDEVASPQYRELFQQNTQDILNLGISESTYWMRIRLHYPDAYPNTAAHKQWLLEIATPSLDIAELFIPELSGIYTVKTSDTRTPYAHREVIHINSVFPIRMTLNQDVTLYVKVKNTTSMYIPLVLWTTEAFAAKAATEEFLFGIFFGSMLILVIYNLYIYLTIRDISYLFYFFYLGGITTFEMLEVGRGIIHLDRYIGTLDRKYIIFFIWMTAISVIYFSRHFIANIKQYPIVDRTLDIFLFTAYMSFIFTSFSAYSIAVLWNACFMGAFLPIFSLILIFCWLKGNENAKYLFFAWISNAIGLTLFAGLTYRILPATQLTLIVTFIGIFIEALLLSFALAHRIKREQVKTLIADHQAMTHLSQYRAVFERSLEGRYTMSLQGRIINVNNAMARLFGFQSSPELLPYDRQVTQVLFDQRETQWRDMRKHHLTTHHLQFQRHDGRTVWAIHKSQLIFDITGEVSHIEGSVIDVTQTQLKNIAIDEKNQEQKKLDLAEAAAKAKSEFLSNMSHEIRTPLTAIIGFSESLKDPLLSSQEKQHAIKLVADSSKNLLQLINNILDYSKLEANRLTLENIPVSIPILIRDIDTSITHLANERHLGFTLSIQFPLPDRVCGDPLRMTQIVTNLCVNAIKFTPKGTIHLFVTWNATRDQLQFSISDPGMGMSESVQRNLFSFFEQADSSSTRKFGGVGLGLAISKKFAHMMGGDIEVQSVLGKGSKFTFWVGGAVPDDTLWVTNQTDFQAYTQPTESMPLVGTVLIAEDNIVNQQLLQKILKKTQLTVILADNGIEACECCKAHEPDVVLMDMNMPLMDGIEATTQLRMMGFNRPIYALTAETDTITLQDAIKAGCEGVLHKPIDKAALLHVLQQHVPLSASPPRALPSTSSITYHPPQ